MLAVSRDASLFVWVLTDMRGTVPPVPCSKLAGPCLASTALVVGLSHVCGLHCRLGIVDFLCFAALNPELAVLTPSRSRVRWFVFEKFRCLFCNFLLLSGKRAQAILGLFILYA